MGLPLATDHDEDAAGRHAEARRFLARLGHGPFTFQTYPDGHGARGRGAVRQGLIQDWCQFLEGQNRRGMAVGVMVNHGDGKGRKTANVLKVRALFVDLDGAPLLPVEDASLRPHMIVETSPGKYHAYWCVEGIALEEFTLLQVQLAERYSGDKGVKDLPRVMRLPGYFHLKTAPFRARLVCCRDEVDRYAREEVLAGLELAPPPRKLSTARSSAAPAPILANEISPGTRNTMLFALAKGFWRKGIAESVANENLRKTNAARCRPPLPTREVDMIVHSAYGAEPPGFVRLPHSVFDSPAFQKLSPVAEKLLLIAARRFNGFNNGNIALPEAELEKTGGRGLRDPKAIRAAKRELLDAGLLRLTRESAWGKAGERRLCALFALPWVKNNRRRFPVEQ